MEVGFGRLESVHQTSHEASVVARHTGHLTTSDDCSKESESLGLQVRIQSRYKRLLMGSARTVAVQGGNRPALALWERRTPPPRPWVHQSRSALGCSAPLSKNDHPTHMRPRATLLALIWTPSTTAQFIPHISSIGDLRQYAVESLLVKTEPTPLRNMSTHRATVGRGAARVG